MSTDLAQIERHNELVEQANNLLSEVVTAQDANTVIREAEAARVFARQVKLGEAAVNHAQAVKIRAEIRLADIVDAGQEAGEVATRATGSAIRDHVRTPDKVPPPVPLRDLGIDRRRLAEARELRTLAPTSTEAEQRVIEEADRATAEGRELSRSGLIQLAREPRREAAREAHRADVEEMREFAESVTPDDYDPTEDLHSSAVQRAILAAVGGVESLAAYDADDVRRALNHSNPKVRAIVLPAYTDHIRTIVELADRFRELLP